MKTVRMVLVMLVCFTAAGRLPGAEPSGDLRDRAAEAMRRAAEFYRGQVASHGGYVYYYALDLGRRWGEGEATADQIWVQPPGTPTVGMAYLKAYQATGEKFYLDAATETAEALIYGQLESGGWTNYIDFDPQGGRAARYRNGKGGGKKSKDNSSLDDGQTQSAIRLLMRVDQAHDFKHKAIHEAATIALEALLAAQFPNGAFPQVWTGPVAEQPIVKADYPAYDWRTEGRIKNYWDMYTLNDDVAGQTADALIEAGQIYNDPKYRAALARLGDFLILAQMPDPQPAWAQQYDYAMHPVWARRFEPPAVSGSESQDVIETLMKVYERTGDPKYLQPIPAALDYLTALRLDDGRLARYYELRTNRPLYMTRQGDVYTLTYDDRDLPSHYSWKVGSRLDSLREQYDRLRQGQPRLPVPASGAALESKVRRIVDGLDEKGRWISTVGRDRMTGQPDLAPGERILSSEVFSKNLETLARYVETTR